MLGTSSAGQSCPSDQASSFPLTDSPPRATSHNASTASIVNRCLALLALIAVVGSVPVANAQTIYWTDGVGPHRGVRRVLVSGANVQDVVPSQLVEDRAPAGLALDLAAGKMYWTQRTISGDFIRRANLDGSSFEDVAPPPALIGHDGIALDLSGGKMYWTNFVTDEIRRANLDGTSVEVLISTGRLPLGIDLDVASSKIYWTEADGRIRRANLDGTLVTTILDSLGSSVNTAHGIALDVAGGKMYWTQRGFTVPGQIRRANLNGTDIEDLVAIEGMNPLGIALDAAAGKMYWTNWGGNELARANLDGSNVETILADDLHNPHGIGIQFTECGDGVVEGAEVCDDVGESASCDADCSLPVCGDRIVNTAAGEECDDGNLQLGDGCGRGCRFEPGACCNGTACTVTSAAGCSDLNGRFFGFYTTCDLPDADGDGLRDDCDGCPSDVSKIEPGSCGCGGDDSIDTDGDGTPDCIDQCPNLAGVFSAPCEPRALPAVSLWGMVVLALLLLTAHEIKFGRRHAQAG